MSEEITRVYSRSRRRLRSVFQNRRSWSAAERGWLRTRMPPGTESLWLLFCEGYTRTWLPSWSPPTSCFQGGNLTLFLENTAITFVALFCCASFLIYN